MPHPLTTTLLALAFLAAILGTAQIAAIVGVFAFLWEFVLIINAPAQTNQEELE